MENARLTAITSSPPCVSLAALKQRGLITHTGSKKTGGYYAVEKREE